MYISCEVCFDNVDGARAAMAELAEIGVESKIFEDVVDPLSDAVFVGVWRAGTTSFEEIVFEIAARHGGLADKFGISDQVPVPADFGYYLPEDAPL
jgi:hypothetical protein